jgi:hypothetical protein
VLKKESFSFVAPESEAAKAAGAGTTPAELVGCRLFHFGRRLINAAAKHGMRAGVKEALHAVGERPE